MIVMFLLFLLLAFGGVTWYIAKRVTVCVKHFFPKVGYYAVLAFFASFTVIMLLGVARLSIPLLGDIFEVISAYWMGILIYLFIFFIISDLVFLVCKLSNASFCKKGIFRPISVLCAVVLTVITVIYGCINARTIRVTDYKITFNGKTDVSDINIVMMSDLHIGSVGSEERLPEIIERVNSLSPDLVLIAGDIFDTDLSSVSNTDKVISNFKNLDSTYGTYACLGNHDGGKTLDKMLEILNKGNVTVLKEEYTLIDNRLVLIGRLDRHSIGGYNGLSRGDISAFFTSFDENLPVIVLDHNPSSISSYKSDVDLVLSGHTHRGQLFPASIITDLMYPCDYGHYQKDPSSPQLIVSSGVGYWGMPMRVGTKSEILNIKITQDKK